MFDRSNPREDAAVLALARANVGPWHEVGDLIVEVGSALAVALGEIPASARDDHRDLAQRLAGCVSQADIDLAIAEVEELAQGSPPTTLVTVLSRSYPENLRQVYDRPPFLFVRGELKALDEDAVAVVGTRQPSPEGLEIARALSSELAARRVTVISGLARGIDAAAHTAALDRGGRTIAVMGTGITRVYPAENTGLADRILTSGALVSQFSPDSPPRRENFPLRNVVTSGLAVGTVVIEASSTSGAKMQARLALEHGKRLFLVKHLVMREEWARKYSERPGAVVVTDVQQILDVLDRRPERVEQLRLV